MKKLLISSAILSSLYIGSTQNQQTAKSWFFQKKLTDSNDLTKTYIWGNGAYQPRPDAPLKFKNLEPKLIKTFLGEDNINLKDVAFGEFYEAGIDTNNEVYIWPKYTLDASASSENDSIRNNILKLEQSKGTAQITFSKGFLWGLKENGDVYQWKIESQIDDITDKITSKVIQKPRKIESLKQIKQISTGEDHFIALDKNGDVWAMGDDTLGQCGLGARSRVPAPPFFQ